MRAAVYKGSQQFAAVRKRFAYKWQLRRVPNQSFFKVINRFDEPHYEFAFDFSRRAQLDEAAEHFAPRRR